MTNRPLRIALPTSTFLPNLGGVEVGLHNIASRLLARGHLPVVITSYQHVQALRRLDWTLPYKVLSYPNHIWGALQRFTAPTLLVLDCFHAYLQAHYRFDFWHGTMGWPIGVSLVHFAKPRGIPHLVRCAGEDIQTLSSIAYGARQLPKIDQLVREMLPKADHLVAITESVAEEYRAIGARSNIVHIPNGVDCSRFARQTDRGRTRAALGVNEGEFLFLCVGRNHPKKGFTDLVRAAALIQRANGQQFRVAFVGAGCTDLLPLAQELGIADRIVARDAIGGTAGQQQLEVPDKALVDIYQSADAFVLPSLIETFGIVLVEAMAAGLPVITTDAPGCRDVVRAGRDGIAVPVGQPEALAGAMQELLRLPAGELSRWSEKSRSRAAEFDWDLVVNRYIALYEDSRRR
jgi:glycosyltransferase involved in cell wall biosynthesis